MAEAEALCDRVAIIDYGRLLAVGTVDDLKASLERSQVTHVEGIIPEAAVVAIRALPDVLQATRKARNGSIQLTVVTKNGREVLSQIIAVLTKAGALIQKINPEEATLEDVFIAKTGRTLAEDTWNR
jgi:ABC-2 type transport system ATP-binding protein